MAFTIDRRLVGGQADVQLTVQGPGSAPEVVAAFATGAPFPDGKLALGSIKLSASTGATIPFSAAGGSDSVTFTASASGFFEAGVYPDPADLLTDLSSRRDIASGISLTSHPASRFMLLRAGYDAEATANGAIALGVGASVTFGGSSSRTASYAVIHEFRNAEGANDVLTRTIKGWILPSQFDDINRFPPGTWVVTELDGGIALNVGVQAGYDFNWIRQMPDGILKGDLGLKVQLAANAALGFSANGAFALVLAREGEDAAIRLRLFKLDKSGLNFALNASAGGQVILPDIFQSDKNITDLITAVFGLHIAQLVDDLTDPTIATPANVAKYLEQLGMKEFTNVTGIDPGKLIAAGQAKVDQFISDWVDLPHKAATKLAALLAKNQNVAKLTTFLQDIQGPDKEGVQALVRKELGQADFFQSAVGQWIESAVPTTALGVIQGSDDWKIIQGLSAKALSILNGQALQTLLEFAQKHLGLDAIKAVQSEVDAINLDSWLQAKLAGFLGKNPATKLVLDDVRKVQTVLKTLLDNAEKFYDLARTAIQKKYEIDLVATYQRSDTSTALLDVTFDFGVNPALLPILHNAVGGDFQQLLIEPVAGVTLNSATLTHDINHQGHSELTMPFVDLSHDSVTDSLASVSPVEDHGRVLMYTLDATNEEKEHSGFFHVKSVSDSKLALKASFPAGAGVRQFSKPPSFSYGYTLGKASTAMATKQLFQDLNPLVDTYLPELFGGGKPTLQAWVDTVDNAVDSDKNGILGETLFTFDVSVSPDALDPWFNSSTNDKDQGYRSLSLAIQTQLRKWIPLYHFTSPALYTGNVVADSVMAYGALPPSNGFDSTGGAVGKPNHEIYFDLDPANHGLAALMTTKAFADTLKVRMQDAASMLRGLSHFQDAAEEYAITQENVDRISRKALNSPIVPSLLFFEFELIGSIVKAAVQLAKFRASAGNKPADAVKQLSGFGDAFVQSFNKRLSGNLVAKSQLRPLGSALFLEAGRALAGNVARAAKTAGLFRLTIIDSAPPLDIDDFLGGNFDPSNVKTLLRETLVSPPG